MMNIKDILFILAVCACVIVYAFVGGLLTTVLGWWISIPFFLGAFVIPFLIVKVIKWWVYRK